MRSAAWLCILGVACTGTVAEGPPDDAAQDAGFKADTGVRDVASADLGVTDVPVADAAPDANVLDADSPDAVASDVGPPADAGQEIVVVVGYGGRRVMSRDGLTWEHFQELTPNGGDDNDLFRGAAYGNGTFVAVGGSSNAYTMTSTDGFTWANENRTPRAWLGGAAALGNNFVAAGGNGLRVRSLDRGRTWQDDAGYQPIHYRDLASANGVVVAVGHNYDTTPNVGVIASTTDGVNWTEHVHDGATFNNVAASGLGFVAAGPSGRVMRSPDGVSWTDVTLGGSGGASVVHTGGDFLVSFDDAHHRSADGITWTPATGRRSVRGYFAGLYLSLDWPARIWVSSDLDQWTAPFAPLGSGFTKIVTGRVP